MVVESAPISSFVPSHKVIEHVKALPLGNQLKPETLLYQASVAFASAHGGPITKEFLSKLPASMLTNPVGNVIVDVRVHRLGAGHYPAIPGYHLDWIPRKNQGADADLSVIPDYEHVVLIVGESSLTEFLAEPIEFPAMPDTKSFEYANRYIKASGLRTWSVPSGSMVYFTSNDWHRPTPSLGGEWRLLIRASRVEHARPTNEVRTQSQVYIPIEEASW